MTRDGKPARATPAPAAPGADPVASPVKGCDGGNATGPSPSIAPGAHDLDPRRIAEDLVARNGDGGIDPRVRDLVPGFDAPFFQAGLAGYSDAPMRLVARRQGCPFCVTEALLDRTLIAGGRGFAKADLGELHDNLPGGDEDHPLAGQIMGSDPAEMAAAAMKMAEQGKRGDRFYRDLAYEDITQHKTRPWDRALVARLPVARLSEPCSSSSSSSSSAAAAAAAVNGRVGDLSHPDLSHPDPSHQDPSHQDPTQERRPDAAARFEVIDVNLACPVKKIAKKARGGHWLAEPEGAIAILEAVREAVPAEIPTTVKMRRSFDDTPEMRENFLRVFDAAYEMGYAWVTVHGRTVEQKYVGPSRWAPIRELTERWPERIVFGSGDVWTEADVMRMLAYTGVSAVSVARGCIGDPWIFRRCRDLLAGREPSAPTIAEQRAVLEAHFDLALKNNAKFRKPELHTGRTMRKFGIRFARWHPESAEVKRRMIAVDSLESWRAVLDEWYGAAAPDPADVAREVAR